MSRRAIVAAVVALACSFAPAQGPVLTIHFRGHPAAHSFKVSKYLLGGSGVKRKVDTFKASKVCNGWLSDDQGWNMQLCMLHLDDADAHDYSYQIDHLLKNGKVIWVSQCQPMQGGYRCYPQNPYAPPAE